MSDDGGPAFPFVWNNPANVNYGLPPEDVIPGMSLKDYFAGQALVGLLARGYPTHLSASEAYHLADTMMAARKAESGDA